MSLRSYLLVVILSLTWVAGALKFYGLAYGFHLGTVIVWWGLLAMTIASAYYAIQEAPAARVSGWLRRDLVLNVALLLILLATILDGVNRFRYLSPRSAAWIAFAVAAIHPVAVDWPHLRHHRADPAGSPIPQYVPPACIAIDWTLAAYMLLAIALL